MKYEICKSLVTREYKMLCHYQGKKSGQPMQGAQREMFNPCRRILYYAVPPLENALRGGGRLQFAWLVTVKEAWAMIP